MIEGMLVGWLVFIVIMIFLIPNIIDQWSKKAAQAEEEEARRTEEEKRKKEYALLVEKYAASELTKKILNQICNGNYEMNRPEKIVIRCDEIESTLHGCHYSFDFKQNRVKPLHHDGDWNVNPTMAMADVFNRFMGGEYAVHKDSRAAHMTLKSRIDF